MRVTLATLLLLVAANSSHALDVHWNGSGGLGGDPTSWQNVDNWDPSGSPFSVHRVPGDGDTAMLLSPAGDRVKLFADTAPINGLTVSNGINLFTEESLLLVSDAGSATTAIAGANTRLWASASSFDSPGFVTDNLLLTGGGELILTEGDSVVFGDTALFPGSRIADHGTIPPIPPVIIPFPYELFGTITFGGDVTLVNASIELEGNSNGESRAVFSGNGSVSASDGSLISLPHFLVVDNNTIFDLQSGSTLSVQGMTVRDGGKLTLSGGSVLDLVDNHVFRVSDGGAATFTDPLSLSAADRFRLEGGQLNANSISVVNGDSFLFIGGRLNPGSYQGTLNNLGGTLAPGDSDTGMTFGDTAVLGDYEQLSAGTLEIELGIVGPGVDFDFVNVTGSAQLDGQLEIILGDGFFPKSTDTFTVLNAGNLLGTFANVLGGQRLDAFDGSGSFQVNYGVGSQFNPDQIVLSDFLAKAGADFDSDNDVDGADFLAIQRSDPSLIPQWEAEFGLSQPLASLPATTQAVPEPATLLLAAVALVVARPLKRLAQISVRERALRGRMLLSRKAP